jgi:hypothetical protein
VSAKTEPPQYYYTYVGEVFNWSNPRILDGLFHGSNGWFLYTPLMLPTVIYLFLGKNQQKWQVTIIFLLLVHVYIAYSWWCWNYINGLGSRPMVDIYALLAFPLAALCSRFSQRSLLSIVVIPMICFFCWLNIKFTWQQYHGFIFSEAQNRAFYFDMLFKIKTDKQSLKALYSNCVQPDSGSLHFQKQLAFYDFESRFNPSPFTYSDDTNKHAVLMTPDWVRLDTLRGHNVNLKKGSWIKVSFLAYAPEHGRIWDAFSTGLFILNQVGKDGTNVWLSFRGTNLIGNQEASIWNCGDTNQWGQIEYFVQLKSDCNSSTDFIEIKGFNPSHQPWYLDDLKIEYWK